MATEADTQKSITDLEQEVKSLTERANKLAEREKEVEKEKEALLNRQPVYGNRSDSDESRCMRAFGVSNAKDLLAVNTGHPRFAGVSPELKSIARQFKEDVDVGRWIAQVCYGDRQDVFGTEKDVIANCPSIFSSNFGKDVLEPKLKTFGTTSSTTGGNWLASVVADSYIEEYELDRGLEGKFTALPMPSSPYTFPVQNGVTKAKIQAENTTMSDSNFTTNKLTFTAVKLAEFSILPEELNEDSAPSIMPIVRKNVIDAQARAIEEAIISGDTTGTHQDSDVTAASDARKAWKGLRKLALANSMTQSFGNAALTDPNMALMRTKGGIYMINPKTALYVSGPKVYNQALGLTNVATVDKFGQAATILQGALAAYAGIPWYVSGLFREDLNVSGVYDSMTTTRAGLLLVNRERFFRGIRRAIRVRVVADLPSQDRWLLQSTSRSDFEGVAQSATETSVVYGINIAV